MDLIRSQLQALATQNNAALSFAFIFGLLFALWSANSGIKTLFEALNVAYEETEKRSFLRLNLISFPSRSARSRSASSSSSVWA